MSFMRHIHAHLLLVAATLVGCTADVEPELALGEAEQASVIQDTYEDGGCTLTQGYWKNHPDAWPVCSLTLGCTVYGKDELLALLSTPPAGDKSLILAHQLIAARLNVAHGAAPPYAVACALASADDWMSAHMDADGHLPYGVHHGDAAQLAVSLADILADFNEGAIGPGHCDEHPDHGCGCD